MPDGGAQRTLISARNIRQGISLSDITDMGALGITLHFITWCWEAPMRGVAAIVLYLISVIVIAVLVVSFLNYGRYGF